MCWSCTLGLCRFQSPWIPGHSRLYNEFLRIPQENTYHLLGLESIHSLLHNRVDYPLSYKFLPTTCQMFSISINGCNNSSGKIANLKNKTSAYTHLGFVWIHFYHVEDVPVDKRLETRFPQWILCTIIVDVFIPFNWHG